MEHLEFWFSIKNILVHIPLGTGYDLSYIEAVGTIFGLMCIWYASREKIINYLYGLINVVLFCIIFYQIQLYANMLLQIYFFVINIYGWYAWSRQSSDNTAVLKVRWMSKTKSILTIVIAIACIIVLAMFINPIFYSLTKSGVYIINLMGTNIAVPPLIPDPYPLLDSTVTILSLIAMVLMTRKYVENWIIWVIINVLSIILYSMQGVYFMALEYFILTFIAVNGTVNWIRTAKQNKKEI
jgi:nicotinamide mononucleotide transporter